MNVLSRFGRRWVAVFAMFIGLAGVSSTVQAEDCSVPLPLSQMLATMADLPAYAGPIPKAQAQSLQRSLVALNVNAHVGRILTAGHVDLGASLVELTDEVHYIGMSATLPDAGKTGVLLSNFYQALNDACRKAEQPLFAPQGAAAKAGSGSIAALPEKLSAMAGTLKDRGLTGANLMVVLLGGFAVVLVIAYILDHLYRYAMARYYNRHLCSIPAIVHVGQAAIEVSIVTLGRGGCRISPQEDAVFDAHADDFLSKPVIFQVHDTLIAADLSAMYDAVSDFRFDRKLPIAEQRALLKFSTSKTSIVKRSRMRPRRKDATDRETIRDFRRKVAVET